MMVGNLLRAQRAPFHPADSSLGAVQGGETIQEGFGGRRVNHAGRSWERPSGWRSSQLCLVMRGPGGGISWLQSSKWHFGLKWF